MTLRVNLQRVFTRRLLGVQPVDVPTDTPAREPTPPGCVLGARWEVILAGALPPVLTLRLLFCLLAPLVVVPAFAWTHPAEARPHTLTVGEKDFLLDGEPLQIRCGEIHFARVPREYWQHRLRLLRAMGLNAVCAYLFWNFHEYREGEFDWSGQRDVAEFCRLAQQEGLWVILRPGPYACAEWDMGGLPWWLLKHEDLHMRSSDPRFLAASARWLKEVGRVLAPLQVQRGGPILLVQVENEYGLYGDDAGYMGALRQQLVDAGFDVPFFACNPVHTLTQGARSDLFNVVNFGKDPAGAFRALRKVQPDGPLMCGEFYPGWYDTWGQPHHTGDTERYLADIEYMLKENASFSIYMAHGGTSFGLWAGANRPFRPDTTSYDYDAPIAEAGWTTEKYHRTRALMMRHLSPGEQLPDPPPQNPLIQIAPFKPDARASLFDTLPPPVRETQPRHMEAYDQGQGLIVHRATLPPGPAATLEIERVHDFGWVFLDGEEVGVLDRRHGQFTAPLPERPAPSELTILVYAMGRVNIGIELHDRKGLHGPVRLTTATGAKERLDAWTTHPMELGEALPEIAWKPVISDAVEQAETTAETSKPHFWKASFPVETPGDTFLDLSGWGKGVVWLNGRCLGRFWNIGPTQTLYVPAPWLRRGSNELVVLDLIGPTDPTLRGVTEPVLDDLRPERDFNRPSGFGRFSLESVRYVHQGRFAEGAEAQDFDFDTVVEARQVGIETLDAHDGREFAAVAEFDLYDADGKSVPKTSWTIPYVNSEELKQSDGSAYNAINGQPSDHWHTASSQQQPDHPHRLVIDLGRSERLRGFRYTPRTGDGRETGRIRNFRVYLGDKLAEQKTN